MEIKNNRNGIIKTIAIICVVTLMTLIILPGCNFIGQTDTDASTQGVNNNSVMNSSSGTSSNELCCPVCSSTDFQGPDEKGNYVCNKCSARWSFDENKIDILNENGDVITTLDSSAGHVNHGNNNVSANNNSGNNGGNGNVSSKPTSTSTFTKTTKSFSESISEINERWKDVIKFKVDEDGNVTVESVSGKDTGLFGFKYSQKDKVFITAEDAWQRNFGFEVTYDNVSGLGAISYDTIRVYFDYGGLEWMVQFWKGQYGFVFIGSEIGVYHREPGSKKGTQYDCATDENKLTMTMDVYRRESSTSNKYNHLFTRSPANTWWLTGFTPGTLQAGAYVVDEDHTKSLKVDATFYFKDEEMASAFVEGLKKVTQIDHNSPKRYRSFKFNEMTPEAYKSSMQNGKFAVEADGKTVHASWR